MTFPARLLSCVTLFCALAGSGAAATRAPDADSLFRSARAKLSENSASSHRSALRDLEAATRAAPDRADLRLAFGQALIDAGQLARGRAELERGAVLAPDDADTQLRLGLAWKWDWLCTLEASSFANAIRSLDRAARLTEKRGEACLAIAALALVHGDTGTASAAARLALEAEPGRGDAMLALACASYWAGDLARADSLFTAALPRLSAASRARFATRDFARDRHAEADSSAWKDTDPDLTTTENEAQLHFYARVAHALLLFRDRGRVRWDARAELFTRYGIPASIVYNPPTLREYNYSRPIENVYAPPPNSYPYNEQVWIWPNLGIQADLWDMTLTQSYRYAIELNRDSDPTPDPKVVADHPELVMLGDGRGVFRTMSPSARPVRVRGHVARFPIEGGSRLIAHLEVSTASDSFVGRWAVSDRSTGMILARGSRGLEASMCDPESLRLAEFQAELPPGDYRIDFSVVGPEERRGLARAEARIAAPPSGLALSDVVPLCRAGTPGATAIHFEPDLEARAPAAGVFPVYFEVRGLTVGADDSSRFVYTYKVRRAASNERRHDPALEASREEAQVGEVRRQFVSVPMGSLPPGAYELEIRVRDLVARREVRSAVRFVRGAV